MGICRPQKTSWPQTAEKLPRQKAYLYVSLIICTAVLIYFYSYPLSWDNWNPIKLNTGGWDFNVEVTDGDSLPENKFNPGVSKTTAEALEDISGRLTQSQTKGQQALSIQNDFSTISSNVTAARDFSSNASSKSPLPDTFSPTQTVIINVTSKSATTVEQNTVTAENGKAEDLASKTLPQNTDFDELLTTENGNPPTVPKGFLVFSNHCRIPDLDPMHPSIRHMVEITPPLNCKNYSVITRTDGNLLILDQETAMKISGGNFSCCYRSVFRGDDGNSDNSVGFGKECRTLIDQAIIQDEFINVKCEYPNGTTFYQEFHSFIHDKPVVEERCKKHQDSRYSVLIVGIDALSRMNMHRQLNATARYLLHDMGAIEMYGFNKVGDNTFPNLIPLLVGYDERELPHVCWKTSDEPLDECDFLWKRFAQRGYRTFYAEDTPHISSFNYIKKGFYNQPTDYYFRHFILAYEDALGRDKRLNCHLCVGSISETEAVLHWLQQFATHFSDRPYFAFSWINSLTHDFLNMGSSGDLMYQTFFRTLHRSGALDKTIVLIMGDHGMRWGEIRKTYIGRLEERLPMLLISLPKAFEQEYPKAANALRLNSHRLVTPFDLHVTLMHLLHMKDDWSFSNTDKVDEELARNFTRRANSLFLPVPEDRSCDDAFIEEHWCTCEASLPTDPDSNDVKNVVQFLIKYINKLLKPVSKKCEVLKLKSISDARIWQPPTEHEGHTAEDNIYTAVFQTSPGGAVFEGTVKITAANRDFELLGTISRLNLYGSQSSCIADAILRKYCFCS